ncbi:hypothetical protein HHK36_010782 [Tetracentron sinense]|uniref:ubiquitinyl hydrolase 1 n=1 Tax=Tetracentron sinense TaxID=13715 RepID=A0A835DJV9_TETSI|nr:hypothetical protein HHK36_010782 [Tetracentron sinense]
MEKTQIYHEKQKLQFCLVHALNNLFQIIMLGIYADEYAVIQEKDAFTRADLNAVAEKLVLIDQSNEIFWTPLSVVFKPHHNAITGNYDVNVLIAALEEKGKNVIWHDRRNGASSIDLNGSEDLLMGIVLNIPVRRFGGIWRSRHWVTLRRIERFWYNFDSDLIAPQPFKDTEELKEFLDSVIGCGGEVLLVMNDKQLPEISMSNSAMEYYRALKIRKVSKDERLGGFGEMMIEMLPDDLAFTVFIPSEKAFQHNLRLWADDSLVVEKMNDTYAIFSRILGFSAVSSASSFSYSTCGWLMELRAERVDLTLRCACLSSLYSLIYDEEN